MLQNVYLGCAAFGGAVLVLQTLASMIGIGHHDGDVDLDDLHDGGHGVGHGAAHLDGDVFLKLFTLKTIVAFLTFFGLAGLASERAGMETGASLALALLAGALALYLVAWMMRTLARLQSRGNVRLDRAVGLSGKVYLRVPPRGEGVGKVTLAIDGRSVELKALSQAGELPTGASVRVVALHAADTLEVAPLP